MIIEDYLRNVIISAGELDLAAYDPADAEEYYNFMASLQLWEDPEVPYLFPWYRAFSSDAEGEARKSVNRIAESVANLTPEKWNLPMLVRYRGKIVGTQDIRALDFQKTRTISTGSLLDLRYQKQGLGKLMRRAMLIFAFEHLGAEMAISGAHPENAASCGVSRACGYQPIANSDIPPLAEEILKGWDYFYVQPQTLIRDGVSITLSTKNR